MSEGDVRREIDARLKALSSQQEERLARRRARELHLPYIGLMAFPMDATALALVSQKEAREVGAVLFYKKGHDIRMGTINPEQDRFVELRRKVTEALVVEPQVYVISRSEEHTSELQSH